MTTLLSILYDVPILIGVFIAVITLVVIFAPWNIIWYTVLWALFVSLMALWYYSTESWKRFKKWMRKREPWCDELEDWFTRNFQL